MTRARARAWGHELRLVHDALRRRVRQVRDGVAAGAPREETAADLRLFCVGFCAALTRHHTAEDDALFPRIRAAHPELAPVIDLLMEDHAMLDGLIQELDAAVRTAPPGELLSRLDGIAAVMDSHFGFEERRLVPVLDAMTDAGLPVAELLGVESSEDG
ncbi:hemerythrin domain-containing protein [Streptomyces avicenniae]|uniref:hemerythrin domain-containing protein n=1 Tax=Streptomyces avicenniae TaxID=500153 RepID=UPI00069B039B|nr:hemerythrin domain-containing protein [Streptomyces avicenniae]